MRPQGPAEGPAQVVLPTGTGGTRGTATPTNYVPTTFSDLPISGLSDVDSSGHILDQGNAITLRSAIIAANAHAGADTISLGAGTYQLSIAPVMSGTFGSGDFHKAAYDNGTGFALNGSLDVTDDLTITGAGQTQTIIDGGSKDVIFSINPFIVNTNNSANTSGVAASLSNLTLQHGDNPSDDGVNGFAAGGAIWWEGGWKNGVAQNSGSLSLDHVTIDHNTTHGGGGGLVVYNGGTVSITNSTFSNNTVTGDSVFASADGGGIIVTNTQGNGTVTITNTDITGNTCTPSGQGGGAGGGLEVVGGLKAYSIAIHGGSISNNSAPNGGGIVELGGNVPSFTIDGGTVISGNTANGTSSFVGSGGGIAAFGNITIGAGTDIHGNQTNGEGGGVLIGGGSSITQASITNNSAGVTGGGVYIFDGPDASVNEAAPSVSFSRIVGNTASLGPNQIDNANVPTSLTDNWLGVNLPGPNDVGASNAVPISSIGPATPGSPLTVTTALPHGFFSGQMLSINGVANNIYDGPAGFNGQQAPTPGVTLTSPTAFTFVWPSGDASQSASNGGYVNQTWPIQTAMESGSTVTLIGVTVPHNIGSGDAGDSTVRPGGNTPNLAVG